MVLRSTPADICHRYKKASARFLYAYHVYRGKNSISDVCYCVKFLSMVLCIHNTIERRDSMFLVTWIEGEEVNYRLVKKQELSTLMASFGQHAICLLYTSDAADEEDSVDLGGRRIIKKKNKNKK